MKHQRATLADIYQLRRVTTSTHELISPALISSSNDIIMGRMGICLMMRRSMLPIHDDVIKWKHFPRYWPFVRGFDVFFDLRPDKRLSKQSRGWWFETPSHSLWRHRNVLCFPMGICVLRCTECRSEFWLFGGLFTFYVRFTKPNVAHNRNR